MKKVVIDNIEYELIENYKDAFNLEDIEGKITDYYDNFTYIVGDYAYSKVRLKGFYDKDNPKCKKYNSIDNLKDYIENKCAYGCKWFELKRIK